jgi:hypothetical protein
MSWDIFAVNVPLVFESIEEIPSDFKPKPLGKRSVVIARIKRIVPTADFSDPSRGQIEKDGWSIELDMGNDETCEDFAFHVRGDGDEAVEVVARILDGLGIRGFDPQAGRLFVTGPSAIASFNAWRAFRDKGRR